MIGDQALRDEWGSEADCLRMHGATTAIVLGSGLGGAIEAFSVGNRIAYADLPGMPLSGVAGHVGELLEARTGSCPVWIARGRSHLYEGRSPREVGAMMRLLAAAGVERVLLTNAAGSLHADWLPGGWMVLTDHLNLTGRSPLEGAPSFLDMQGAYDLEMRETLLEAAARRGIEPRQGVYAAVPGPQYETSAEVRMLRLLGADAVGMSTAMECIQARAVGMRVAGVSLLTNLASGIGASQVDHAEVLAAGADAGGELGGWLQAWLDPGLDRA